MQGISTLTQKGQVAIPKPIRDYFKLQASDRLHFSIEGDRIVAKPAPSISEMRGFIKAKRAVSKAEMKKIIKEAVVTKYANRT